MSVFKAGKFELDLSKKTYIMGILNVTPDSFSDGGKWLNVEDAVAHALQMHADGADIIDIGAQSTRPGCVKISAEEELKRLLSVLSILRGQIRIPISVDTFYPKVAKETLNYGVDIINDVTGFKDSEMVKIACQSDCGCIIMHDGPNSQMRGFFEAKLETVTSKGIAKDRICFDPGVGFGKTYEENLSVIKNLSAYVIDGCAMLIGVSRKRVIGTPCGNPPFEERLPGTIAAHTIALMGGANILRVHDVKEAIQAARVADAVLRA